MKFICDVHIPYKLVNYLRGKDCACFHVNAVFSDPRTADRDIAKHADENDLIVITKDEDFKDSYILNRTPGKLIMLNTGNSSTQQMIDLFENNWSVLLAASQRSSFFIESDIHHFYFIETDD